MLHWSNDPLLLDKNPAKMNDWETANTLIEQERLKRVINEDLSFTNLYGIMVRKIDFVRKKKSDRIIARFPFLVITDEQKEQIQAKILLIAEAARDYFYRSINKSILTWRDVLADYLERGAIPFPLFRCAQEVIPDLQLPVRNSRIPFTSARGEAFSFPPCITKPLAYLCGICNGDGNLRNYWVIIIDETKEHIENISKMLGDIFGKKGHIMQDKGAWVVKLNLLWATRLFNFITNQSINKPKYQSLREPSIYRTIGKPYRNLYWRGVFDADGSFKNQIVFCSISKLFCSNFQSFLTEHNLSSKIFDKSGKGYQVNLSAGDKFAFANLIGTSHPKKISDLFAFLEKSYPRIVFTGINEHHLTPLGYFNFQLLPTMSVLGLADYFDSRNNLPSNIITSKEIKRYKEGKGITMRKLSKLLSFHNQDLMPFLQSWDRKLYYRSSTSEKITLSLKPTKKLLQIMNHLVPTVRGVTINGELQTHIQTIEVIFGVVTTGNIIKNSLLSRYLEKFGNYQKTKDRLPEKLRKSLQERMRL